VTGSDIRESSKLEDLRGEGALVDVGHDEGNVLEREVAGVNCLPDAMVVSSAVSADNVEVRCALKYNIPLYKRGAWLGRVTSGYNLVSVAGTHGKTTTATMVALVLENLEREDGITAIVGGDVKSWNGGSMVGTSNLFVLEADEYDRAFLDLHSKYAIVTNVELDHLDIYESEDEVFAAFEEFLENVSEDGATVMCGDDPGCRILLEKRTEISSSSSSSSSSSPSGNGNGTIQTYGLQEGNDWRATDLKVEGGECSFRVEYKGKPLGTRLTIPVTGTHNVLNALGAIALAALVQGRGTSETSAEELERSVASSAEVLAEFQGVERRCQVIGEKEGSDGGKCVVVSDYAHHPTEVQATLEGVRGRYDGRKLVVVFEPHTLSRLAYFFGEFVEALAEGGENVVVSQVFEPIKTWISPKVKQAIAEDLAAEIGLNARYIHDAKEVVAEVVAEVGSTTGEDTVVLVLGAGQSHSIALDIFDAL